MKVLDLCAGLGGWSQAFRDRGHDVTTVDNDPRFGCTVTADILDWEPEGVFDVVLASPPCEVLSVGGRFTHWAPGYEPADDAAHLAIRLVRRCVGIIGQVRPAFYIMENPRGMLRRLFIVPFERRTVWYCHLGENHAKPTDLWGGFPPTLELPGPCHNRKPDHSDDCCCRDHDAAPRGAKAGTQGFRDAARRALVPYELSLCVAIAAESDHAAGRSADDYTGALF